MSCYIMELIVNIEYYVIRAIPSMLHGLTHLFLTLTIQDKYYYYAHLTDDKNEAERDCLWSHSKGGVGILNQDSLTSELMFLNTKLYNCNLKLLSYEKLSSEVFPKEIST